MIDGTVARYPFSVETFVVWASYLWQSISRAIPLVFIARSLWLALVVEVSTSSVIPFVLVCTWLFIILHPGEFIIVIEYVARYPFVLGCMLCRYVVRYPFVLDCTVY